MKGIRALLYWASGFGTFAALLCLGWLPPPSGGKDAGVVVLVASIIMIVLARQAKGK